MPAVLIIELNVEERARIQQLLEGGGYTVIAAASEREAFDHVVWKRSPQPDVLLMSFSRPADDVLSMIAKFRQLSPHYPIILHIPPAHMALAVEAISRGAQEWIALPAPADRLRQAVQDALGSAPDPVNEDSATRFGFEGFIGTSQMLSQLLLRARAYAYGDKPFLIRGERGTGKTMLAQAIGALHARQYDTSTQFLSAGRDGSLPDRIKTCGKHTTLVLDLTEPSLKENASQSLAYRAMELSAKRGFRLIFCQRVSRHLHMLEQHRALEDSVTTVTIPPLRERSEDIVAQTCVMHIRIAGLLGRQPLIQSQEARMALLDHPWPGNSRELKYALFQAYLLCEEEMDAPTLKTILQPSADRPAAAAPFHKPSSMIRAMDETGELRPLEAIEEDYMRLAFHHYRGRKSEIARRLGIGRTTLYRKAKRLALVK